MRLLYKQKIETEELQMKKFLAMLLVAAMVFSMAACAKAPEAAQPAATEETAGETAETAEAPKDGKVYKVAMICDSSISDGGWGMSCYNAMMDAAEKHGWETAVSDSIEQSAYFDTIDSYCTLGYDMIYAPGNQYTDAVLQAAAEYPDIAFALLNGAADTPAKAENGNVSSLLPNATQIGWIAGALAGLMTETGTIAFIGGMELDTTKGIRSREGRQDGNYSGYRILQLLLRQRQGHRVRQGHD